MKTLFYGGTILTMDKPVYAEAVLTEDGKILQVGTKAQLESMADEQVNLEGNTMMPGFVDPHSHFFQVAAALLQVSLNGADNTEEMKRRIQDFIKTRNIQPGQWVTARDYDNNIMPGLQNPTLADLDAFAPQNPLVIHHKSGHMGLMNSKALEFLHITADTPVPEGGKIEVRDGKLTGYLEENAFFQAQSGIPMVAPAQLLQAFAGAQEKYASYGITTVQDGMVNDRMLPMYQMLLDQNSLYLDVVMYAGVDFYQAAMEMLEKYPRNSHLTCGGMKMFLDGSPQGRTAWMRQPYAGSDGYCGYGTMTDEAVTAAFCKAAENNTQIICHCNGDGAAAQFLRCLEKAEETHPNLKQLHPVIIHGQLMGADQVLTAAKLGAMISFFVAHVYHWGDVHIRNFGMERASRISPAHSAMEAGVNVTFHQDAPVIEPDMLETIWCATNRITKAGVQLSQQERISTLDAIKAVTVNAARQYGRDDIGVIAAGRKADFVILSRNPLEVPPEDLRSIRILGTYKEGRRIYCAD